MGFEKIGPYEITRRDLLVAALVISFRMGSVPVRLWTAFLLLLALGALALGVSAHDPVGIGIGFFLLFVLFLAPALRSRTNVKAMVLERDPAGLALDLPKARIVYKWSTIGKVKRVGPRLYVMVSGTRALVIPDRATSAANMGKLQAAIAEDRQA